MDRDKAVLYFKQLGFTSSAPLHVKGQRRSLTAREMVVEGDGLGDVWTHSSTDPDKKRATEAKGEEWGDCRPLLLSSRGDEKKKVQSFAQKFITVLTISPSCTCSRNQTPRRETDLAAEAPASDYDSDEDGLSLDRLLQLMGRLHKRPSPKAASSTLVRLAACFSPTDTLTDQHVDKLLSFLDCKHSVVRETCLKVVERLLALNRGCLLLVQRTQLVDKVIDLTQDGSQGPGTHIMAMCVLDKMLNMVELDYHQVRQRLDTQVYPRMLQCLHGNDPLDVKYAACCIVRSLARDADFAARVKKESLFLLRQLQYSSARLKEVYVGVLMAMFSHPGLTEAGSVDTGVLPVLKGLLRDGPCEIQKQALELVQCVMSDERGVEAVAGDHRMVAYILACLLSSKCRKVRAQASLVLNTLTSPHKVVITRSLLEAIGQYVLSVESTETGGEGAGKAMNSYPVPAKNQAEALMWHQLDCFLDSVAGLLRSEGLITMETDHVHSELPVKGEISGVQLSCLTYLLRLMVNVSTWPLHRREVGLGMAQVPPLDVTHLCQDLALRERFSRLNHRLAVQQWKRFGPSVLAVLGWMSQRIAAHLHPTTTTTSTADLVSARSSRPPSSGARSRPSSAKSSKSSTTSSRSKSLALTSSRPSSAKPCSPAATEILTDAEQDLVHALLDFLLCMTLVTCKRLADPLCAQDSQQTWSPEVGSVVKKLTNPEPSNGLWVNANPHLTQSVGRAGPSLEDAAHKQQEDVEREALSSRRKVRRELYNQGLFHMMAPFLQLKDADIKAVSCLILRTAVQPLEEKAAGKKDGGEMSSITSFGPTSLNSASGDRRPQSAMNAPGHRQTEKQINTALLHMSPSSAALVRDALGPRPQSVCKAASDKALTLTSARRPGSAFREILATDNTHKSTSSTRCQSQGSLHPLVAGQPINRECQREAAVTCGGHVIQNLFCRSRHIKLCSLACLYDLIRFTTVPVHMELSKWGIIPKMLDFIRVSDDDEQLQILGLRIVGLLTSSDLRLQQLFSHHGGHTLLMALARSASPGVREQVRATLATVTKGHDGKGANGRRQRPASAPLNRRESCPADMSEPARDIWEHIMQRWAQEDRVVEVLQKFF